MAGPAGESAKESRGDEGDPDPAARGASPRVVRTPPTRASPRLAAKAAERMAAAAAKAAADSKADSNAAAAGSSPVASPGPVSGAAACGTPSRFAPASSKPKPRRGRLGGGGAVRVLVDPSEASGGREGDAAAEGAPARDDREASDREASDREASDREASSHPPPAASSRGRKRARASSIEAPSRPARTPVTESSAGRAHGLRDLTVPVSPAFATRSKRARLSSRVLKSSEELAFERAVAEAAEERAERAERRAAVMRRASSAATHASRAREFAKPPTRPESPKLTRRRVTAAADLAAAVSPFRSLAERVAATAPDRSRVHGNGKPAKPTDPGESYHARAPTVPKSPALSRGGRGGGWAPPAKTTEELELEAIARAPKFKARGVRASVLRGAAGAAEKAREAAEARREAAAKAASAKPAPFAAATGRKRKAEEAEELAARAERGARRGGASSGGGGGVMGGALNAAAPCTFPESPKLRVSRRAVLRAPWPTEAPATAAPASTRTTNASVDAYRVDGVTQSAPFRLTTERRGAYAEHDLARRVSEQNARAEKRRRHSARPVPATNRAPARLSAPDFKPPTAFAPFRLRGEALHEYEARREAKRREEEAEEARRRATFVAKPAPFTTFNPLFALEPNTAALTEPTEVGEAGRRRAEQRARFEEQKRRDREAKEALEREEREAREREERRLTREYRKSTRFEARPVPDWNELAGLGVRGDVEERPLTKPESPALRTKRRSNRW